MREKTRLKVLEKDGKLYFPIPDSIARALQVSRTKSVMVVFGWDDDADFITIVRVK